MLYTELNMAYSRTEGAETTRRSRLRYFLLHRKRWWIPILIGIFGLMIPFAQAAAPGTALYPIKRISEGITTAAPLPRDLRNSLSGIYANRRVGEALAVTERLSSESAEDQIKDEQLIEDLLTEYTQTASELIPLLDAQLEKGEKISERLVQYFENPMYVVYVQLLHLRLQAPPAAQAAVLRAIQTNQLAQATVADAVKQSPVSQSDVKELTTFVSTGFLTKQELTQLLNETKSNRQLLSTVRELVKSGKLPASALYVVSYDRLEQVLPKELSAFRAEVEFDELRKIALLVRAIQPSAQQQKEIQEFLKGYTVGKPLPTSSIRPFVAPLIYGLGLANNLPTVMENIEAAHLSPERKVVYLVWQPIAHQPIIDTKQTFGQLIAAADTNVTRDSALLERIQLEVLKALRDEVAYLALPPTWTANQVVKVKGSFEQSIAALKQAEVLGTSTQKTIVTLATVTTPLLSSLPNAELDQVRLETKAALDILRQRLVQNTLAKGVATSPLASPLPLQPPKTSPVPLPSSLPLPDSDASLDEQINALREEFKKELADVQKQVDELPNTTAQVTALQAAFDQSVAALKTAQTQLSEQAQASATQITNVKKLLADIEATQAATTTELKAAITDVEGGTSRTLVSLQQSVQDITATQVKNSTSLQAQLDEYTALHNQLQVSLFDVSVAQAEQTATLQSQLTVSDEAREQFKTEATQLLIQLAASTQEVKETLTAALDEVRNISAEDKTELQKAIGTIQATQTQLADKVEANLGDTSLLRSQLQTSVAEVKHIQDELADVVDGVRSNQTALTNTIQDIQALQQQTMNDLDAQKAETQTLKTEIEQGVAASQAVTERVASELTEALLGLDVRFQQSLSEVKDTQIVLQTQVGALTRNVNEIQDGVDSLKASELALNVKVQAQADELAALKVSLATSISELTAAQTQIQADLDLVKGDVGTLKTSIDAIGTAQASAQAKLDTLTATWSTLPATLQFDRAAFDAAKQELDDEFTKKAAELEKLFQQYHDQLDADIARLRSTTDQEILRLQQKAAQLQAQLETVQGQLPQQTSTTTTTSEPVASSLPVETSPRSVTSSPVPTVEVQTSPAVSEPTSAPVAPAETTTQTTTAPVPAVPGL